MKTVQFIRQTANALMVAVLSFAACKHDTHRLVSRVDEISGNVVEYTEYTYDAQNRVTSFTRTDRDEEKYPTAVSYPDACTLIMSVEEGDLTFVLNSEGYIASVSGMGDPLQTFTYADGHLQRIETAATTNVHAEGELGVEHTGTHTVHFTWENGNVKRMTEKTEFPTAPARNSVTTLVYEYSAVRNQPAGVDLGNLFHHYIYGLPCGYVGKSTVNLPSKMTMQYDDGHADESITVGYETDSEGYVTKITLTGRRDMHYEITYQ